MYETVLCDQCCRRPEEGGKSPRAGIPGSCDLSYIGAEN